MDTEFELTEIQKLRIQLAIRDWELNAERRLRMEAEIRFHQLAKDMSEASLKFAQSEESRLAREQEQLVRRLIELTKETKAENNWPDEVSWDAITREFSVPVIEEQNPAVGSEKKKLLIH